MQCFLPSLVGGEMFKSSKLFFWTIEMLAVVTLIWLLTHISFVFKPVTTLFSLVFLPFIIVGFLYYVFRKNLS